MIALNNHAQVLPSVMTKTCCPCCRNSESPGDNEVTAAPLQPCSQLETIQAPSSFSVPYRDMQGIKMWVICWKNTDPEAVGWLLRRLLHSVNVNYNSGEESRHNWKRWNLCNSICTSNFSDISVSISKLLSRFKHFSGFITQGSGKLIFTFLGLSSFLVVVLHVALHPTKVLCWNPKFCF